MIEPRTVGQLLAVGERVLSDSSHLFEDHDFRDNAEQLMAATLGIAQDRLDERAEPSVRLRDRYLALVTRRAAGEPLPLLTGRIEFWGLDLRVRPGAFMPRPSSELTVGWSLDRLRRRKGDRVVVDVCTGTGPIALALARELPDAEVWGTDISEEGLRQGRANARRLGLQNVRFKRSDMYAALPKRLRGNVDLITGHVPYVPVDELDDLPSEVREFEPIETLTDHSADGLGLMRKAVYGAVDWLEPGGWLELEVSEDLGTTIEEMCWDAGLQDAGVVSDEDRLSVLVEARKPRRRVASATGSGAGTQAVAGGTDVSRGGRRNDLGRGAATGSNTEPTRGAKTRGRAKTPR